MLRRVITGGQTGVDQAAWRAARAAGLETSGLMPRAFQTEAGPRPDLAHAFSAIAGASNDPADRTLANVAAADATLVLLGGPPGPGTQRTIDACRDRGKTHLVVKLSEESIAEARAWIAGNAITALNVAGDRESTHPGIGARAESFLRAVFRSD